MTQATPMPQPAARRSAGLVAVDGRTYPLASARLRGRAEGGVAATTLTQTFQNPYDEPLEVSYTLPLPADGAVTGYTIHVGERTIRGEVRSREEAAAEYRKALHDGRSASLLEQDRDDTFTQQIGCIPGKQDVRVEIDLLQPLVFVPGDTKEDTRPRWELRFPTVAGVRYQGGPGRVPDAERLEPDRAAPAQIGARFGFGLLVSDGSPGELNVTCPSHETRCEESGAAAVVRSTDRAALDRDLVLSWNAGTEDVGVRLTEGPGLEGDDGRYGLVTITPPSIEAAALRRDLTILIDASGSMMGDPLTGAKAIASALLKSLDVGDRFELLGFSMGVRRYSPGMADASEVAAALEWLDRLNASGGTEMNQAIVEAIRPLREDSQRQVVLLTDGYIGFEHEIVGTVMRDLPSGCRVHTVGLGSAPNRTLTRSLARAGRGTEVVASGDVKDAARRLSRSTARPQLTEVMLAGSALVAHRPAALADVLAGSPLRVPCELRPEGGLLEVRGRLAAGEDGWVRRIEVPAARPEDDRHGLPFGALFGREAIADLQLQQAARDETTDELNRAIEAAGLRHRIVGPGTSLVAVAEEPTIDPNAPKRRERLPVEIPSGLSAEAVGMGMPMTFGIGGGEVMDLMQPRFLRICQSEVVALHNLRLRTIEIDHVRVLHADGARLVVELTVPDDGFLLPKRVVEVTKPGVPTPRMKAKVQRKESSPLGPHDRGLTVRLTLVLGGKGSWKPGKWRITWESNFRSYATVVTIGGEDA